MHKKKYLFFFTGFLVLLLTVFVSTPGHTLAVTYSDYYNFDSGDLLRAYQFWRQQSIDFYPEYYSEYSSIMSIWNEADKVFSGDLVRNWETIADSLNQALYNNFNSKSDTADYEDRNLLCLFIPSMNLGTVGASGQQTMYFMFIPYPYRTLRASETRGSQTVSGETEYFYYYQLRLATTAGDINTNLNNVTNNFLLMAVPLNTASAIGFSTKESSNNTFFTQWTKYYRSKYSWTRSQLNTTYGYGLFKTFRDYIERDGCQIMYHSYDMMSGLSVLSRIYYYFDMQDNSIYSYDSAPQEPSSGDSGDTSGEGIDLTETNTLLGNLSTDLTTTPGSGDFTPISSGDITSALGDYVFPLPYTTFWSYFMNGIKDCLDYDGTASLTIRTTNFQKILYPSDFYFDLPGELETFIPNLWTLIAMIVLLKYTYEIYCALSRGDAIQIASQLSDEDIDKIL